LGVSSPTGWGRRAWKPALAALLALLAGGLLAYRVWGGGPAPGPGPVPTPTGGCSRPRANRPAGSRGGARLAREAGVGGGQRPARDLGDAEASPVSIHTDLRIINTFYNVAARPGRAGLASSPFSQGACADVPPE